jgi:predicted small secreted protein
MKTFTTAALLALGLFLAGCNTVKGVGQDVQKAGSALENAAKK